MKKALLTLAITASLGMAAQNIEVVSNQLVFQATDEKNFSNAEIKVYNPGIYVLQVSDIDLFSLYGHEPFSVSDTSFLLNPLDTQTVVVTFLPEQNVYHDMELVIKTSSGFGHLKTALVGQGSFSKPYYASTQNLKGAALRSALASLVDQNYYSLGYTLARDHMYATIFNDSGEVECVYTGRRASFTTRAGANNNSFNCEHTFPQGMFNQNEPMRSDIHHLFPTDVGANSQRGNDPFGVVNNPVWSQGGSKSGGGKFEPRNVQKGATARAMMYFVLRYQDYNNFYGPQEPTLIQWHQNFPPTSLERQRNDQIYSLQNNYNPFVDYPQFMRRMSSLKGNADLPDTAALYLSDDSILLARAAGRYIYDYVLVNEGNRPLKIWGFGLSAASMTFDPPAPDTVILAPQAGVQIGISFQSSNLYQNEELSFSTDIAGMNNVAVPINSGAQVPVSLPEMSENSWEVYPNPADSWLQVKGVPADSDLLIYDMAGVRQLQQHAAATVNVSALPAGMYLLGIRPPNKEIRFQKLMVD